MKIDGKTVLLCSGDILGSKKKIPKCLHSSIRLVKDKTPLYAGSSYMKEIEYISIYCKKKHRNIRREVSECGDYQNTTLEQHL